MAIRKRTKHSRMRGSHTHKWGSKKKHRGSGNRGGRGNAGTGKRSHSNKPSIWSFRYFGRFGRTREDAQPKMINVGELDALARSRKETTLDLTKLGYARLMGKGVVSQKLSVIVKHASPRAQEKLAKAGGSITNP